MAHPNIAMIEKVARGLGDLLADVVFVGGATVALYMDDDALEDHNIRPTNDVDCIVEITTMREFQQLERKLEKLGFKHSTQEHDIICRWTFKGTVVDVMPSESKLIGFENRWYPEAIHNTQSVQLSTDLEIKIFSAPYFLATKASAFEGRKAGLFLESRDFEDMVAVLDGRSSIRAELRSAPEKVRQYLSETFSNWLKQPDAQQAIMAHLPGPRRNVDSVRRIVDIAKNI